MAVGDRLSVHPAARGSHPACSSGAVLTPIFEVVAETGSTNADLAARIRAGDRLDEGFWLRAERQTGGRGRRGRAWDSPAGNLYCSTIVRIDPGDGPAYALSFVAALAVDDLLDQQLRAPGHGVPRLKWPNDVLVDGAKISGILLEQVAECVIVGIGINVAHAPALPDRATCSVEMLNGGDTADPQRVLSLLAPMFAARVAQWRSQGLAAILSAWEERAHPRGTALAVKSDDAMPLRGEFAGLAANGSLRLRLADGSEHVIHAADVSLI